MTDAAAFTAQWDQYEADALAAVRTAVTMLAKLIEGGFSTDVAQTMVSRWWADMYGVAESDDWEEVE